MTASRDEMRALMRALKDSDRDRAVEIRREILESADEGPIWGAARAELAMYELGLGNYAAAAAMARHILDATPTRVDPSVRGVAGVVLCDALEASDNEVNDKLLRESIGICLSSGEILWAAAGIMILSRGRFLVEDRAGAKAALEEAARLFDQSGSQLGSPGALLRLATLEAEDGRRENALRAIDEAIAQIGKIPVRIPPALRLERQLLELRATLT